MFTDIGKDWTSGPPSDWQSWIPTVYSVNFNLYRYEINLYANDQNIIDKPMVCEDNGMPSDLDLLKTLSYQVLDSFGDLARRTF
jgi:hypothetical protein